MNEFTGFNNENDDISEKHVIQSNLNEEILTEFS